MGAVESKSTPSSLSSRSEVLHVLPNSSATQLRARKPSKRLQEEQVPGLYKICTVQDFVETLSTNKQFSFVHNPPLCSHFYLFR